MFWIMRTSEGDEVTDEQRAEIINWLMLAYPFKAESYFTGMSDTELLREYQRLQEIV